MRGARRGSRGGRAAVCARPRPGGLGRGRVSALQGIRAGIENTNYFVSSDAGEWVLTLFERLGVEQLPFYLRYMQHLAQHGIPVPEPQADSTGQILHRLCGRPAALVNRLAGRQVLEPGPAHIAQMGEMLARLQATLATLLKTQSDRGQVPTEVAQRLAGKAA